MYSDHPKKRDFLFWCYTAMDSDESCKIVGQKRAMPTEAAAPVPKPKSSCVRKISEVEEIIKDLREKHGTDFSIEQFSM